MTATPPVTRDALLGGKVWISQPVRGYRAGVDAVLLASACPARPGESVLELGCGVGAAALCLMARVPGLAITGVERQVEMAALARTNAAEAEAEAAFEVVTADLAALPPTLRERSFAHVIFNPPYFDRSASVASPDSAREAAMGEETPLGTWLDVATKRLAPRGWLTLIQRAERLPDILAGLGGLGSIAVQPLVPRTGRPSSLVLVRARKDGRAPFTLHAPLVLHAGSHHTSDGEDYTDAVRAVLRDGAALPAFGNATLA